MKNTGAGSLVFYGGLSYLRGPANAMADVLNRVAALVDTNDNSRHLADYTYLGAGRVVRVVYPQPQVRFNLITGAGDDPYDGLDRFGRLKTVLWDYYDDNPPTVREQVAHEYDRAGNRTARDNDLGSVQDELYAYDDLYQLSQLKRGTIASGQITNPAWQELFQYDPTGNWHGAGTGDDQAYITKVSGSATLKQNRTHNAANEITGISETLGDAWLDPVHDAVGNMTTIPRPASPTDSFLCQWDAWNRLVRVSDDEETTVAEYAYDGLFRRVKKTTAATGEGRHYYYTRDWRVVEERVEDGEDLRLNRQWVWGIQRLDDLVMRDRDLNNDGTLDERLYALQDALNVTGLTDIYGNVVERYGYDGFGGSRVMAGDWSARSSSSYDWEIRFGGYRCDPETGLCQVRFRYLHPGLGRWLSRDRVFENHFINLFTYANNNAYSASDIFGLFTLPQLIAVLVVAGLAV